MKDKRTKLFRQLSDSTAKGHYRLYKSGKLWVNQLLIGGAVVLGLTSSVAVVKAADATSAPQPATRSSVIQKATTVKAEKVDAKASSFVVAGSASAKQVDNAADATSKKTVAPVATKQPAKQSVQQSAQAKPKSVLRLAALQPNDTVADFIANAKTIGSNTDFKAFTDQYGTAATANWMRAWLNSYQYISVGDVKFPGWATTHASVAIAQGKLTADHVDGGNSVEPTDPISGLASFANGGVQEDLTGASLIGTQPTMTGWIMQQAIKNISAFYHSLASDSFYTTNGQFTKANADSLASDPESGITKRTDDDGQSVYVVHLYGKQGFNTLQAEGFSDNDTVVYDVTGSGKYSLGTGNSSQDPKSLVWNLPDFTNVDLTTTVDGKILAPNAVVDYNNSFSGGIASNGIGDVKPPIITEDTEVNFTVHFEGAGDDTPDDIVQSKETEKTTDEGTGLVTYGKVTFDPVDVPQIPGYSTEISVVDGPTITDGKSQTVTVTYVADDTAKITFVDVDDGNKTVGDTTIVSGKPDATVDYDVTEKVPDGYELVEGDLEGNITFTPGDDDVQIHLKHKHEITKDVPVDFTVNYDGAGKNTPKDNVQHGTTTKDTDLVTKKSTYTPVEFKDVPTPTVPGYDPDDDVVDGPTITDGQSKTVTVHYTASQDSAKITFVDDDANGKQVGKVTTVDGHTDESKPFDVTKDIPDGYELVPDNKTTGTITFTPGNDDVQIHLQHKHEITKDVPVDFTVNYEGAGKNTPSANVQHGTTTKDTDLVTKKSTYTPVEFKDVPTPTVPGYTTKTPSVDGPTITDGQSKMVTVKYTADDDSAKITFVDDDSNGDQVGEATIIKGKTGESKNFNVTVPAGYELVPDNKTTGTITFTPGNDDVKIHLKHKHEITKDVPVDFTVNYDGAGKNTPKDNVQRGTTTKDTDLVTKKSTYTPVEFNDVPTPTVPGYTTKTPSVEGPTITDGRSQKVTVHYNAKEDSAKVTFVDDDANGKQVGQETTVEGHTDESKPFDVTNDVPAGYELVPGSKTTGTITFTPGNDDVKIHLKHKHVIKEDISVNFTVHYQNGGKNTPKDNIQRGTTTSDTDQVTHKTTYTPVAFKDVKTPDVPGYNYDKAAVDGPTITDGKSQEATVTYTAKDDQATITFIDDVTGKQVGDATSVTGKTDETKSYNVTNKLPKGYELVPGNKTTGEITFTPGNDDVQIHLTHGTETVTTGVDGLTRDVTRTIHYINGRDQSTMRPNVTQRVSFKRSALIDKVTGDVIKYNAWQPVSTANFAKQDSPLVAGYTADKKTVAQQAADPSALHADVTVTYHADEQAGTVTYIDDTTGKTLRVDQLKGQTDTSVNYPAAALLKGYANAGYTITANDLPADGVIRFSAAGANVYTVHLTHATKHITPTAPGKPGTPVDPTNPTGPKWPADSSKDQLVKTITETVTYVYADGREAAKPSRDTVTFTREGTVDLVTGEVTFTAWVAQDGDDTFDAKNSPQLAGYTASQNRIEAIAHMTADAADQVFKVVYTKDSAPKKVPTPETPQKPETPAAPKATPRPVAKAANNVLPKTGDETATGIGYVGLLLASLSALLMVGGKKRRD
ncbi:mucin-binding protein [Lacticaseibacillus mingshuiensis]|uniref:LPXTG cell wall anchor domain-containing protein n=1 Tax=Lacticaseibacillus mingshuiensis TaxID=2799574 RepID=A0ABW4CHP8_9LACO|nr:LPXTG cell wall anchor domain-containing protein [Lacticaseibacillus mingshuiensis]